MEVIVEPHLFKIGEIVSYYGCARIEKIEIIKARVDESPNKVIKQNRDYPYYHVINLQTGERNQEFNNTLKKDPLGQLIYG